MGLATQNRGLCWPNWLPEAEHVQQAKNPKTLCPHCPNKTWTTPQSIPELAQQPLAGGKTLSACGHFNLCLTWAVSRLGVCMLLTLLTQDNTSSLASTRSQVRTSPASSVTNGMLPNLWRLSWLRHCCSPEVTASLGNPVDFVVLLWIILWISI